jgi:hypothetical protein
MRTAPSRRDVLTSDLGHPKSPSGLPSQLDLDLLRVLSEFLTRWAFPPPVVAGWIGVDDDLLGAEPLIHEGGYSSPLTVFTSRCCWSYAPGVTFVGEEWQPGPLRRTSTYGKRH